MVYWFSIPKNLNQGKSISDTTKTVFANQGVENENRMKIGTATI